MKKLIFLLVCIFSIHTMAFADNEKPIQIGQLPTKAQQFITKYFGKHKVALAKVESSMFYKSYDVIFTNGEKLEFDKNGEWTEVKCEKSAVPQNVVPPQIRKFVRENYPDAKILKIERDSKEYEVKLSNRLEIKFDTKFRVIDIDD
ncbi:PepSY-like domain-containing protein [uncultured Bacteroides sp.]|uniref:PepSY-like domain-containing protein n=1 Tax=uncultured Bacteroides sp. TaxID=162156 RepID=UPI002622494C|nr:PepSY-like domain-containing protein [uncultured Bacteroides sp.]